MAVQEQTPLREYTANGVTTSFALGFDCEETNHLIVTIDDVEVLPTDWYLSGSNVIFWNAPSNGKLIKLQRNTPFNRLADYQSYNNSFRPPAINKEFDRIWWKLQELGVADWILHNRIDALKAYVDRQDSELQQNIDNLKIYVDDKDDELRAYLLEEIRKQGVALDQLDEYYNYLMQRLAQIAVDKGWDAAFVVDASGKTQQEINNINRTKTKSVLDYGAVPSLDIASDAAFAAAVADLNDGDLLTIDGSFYLEKDWRIDKAINIDCRGDIYLKQGTSSADQNTIIFYQPIFHTATGADLTQMPKRGDTILYPSPELKTILGNLSEYCFTLESTEVLTNRLNFTLPYYKNEFNHIISTGGNLAANLDITYTDPNALTIKFFKKQRLRVVQNLVPKVKNPTGGSRKFLVQQMHTNNMIFNYCGVDKGVVGNAGEGWAINRSGLNTYNQPIAIGTNAPGDSYAFSAFIHGFNTFNQPRQISSLDTSSIKFLSGRHGKKTKVTGLQGGLDDHWGYDLIVEDSDIMSNSNISWAGGNLTLRNVNRSAQFSQNPLVTLRADTPTADGDLVFENCNIEGPAFYSARTSQDPEKSIRRKAFDRIIIKDSTLKDFGYQMIGIRSYTGVNDTREKTELIIDNVTYTRQADAANEYGLINNQITSGWNVFSKVTLNNVNHEIIGVDTSAYYLLRYMQTDVLDVINCTNVSMQNPVIGRGKIIGGSIGNSAGGIFEVDVKDKLDFIGTTFNEDMRSMSVSSGLIDKIGYVGCTFNSDKPFAYTSLLNAISNMSGNVYGENISSTLYSQDLDITNYTNPNRRKQLYSSVTLSSPITIAAGARSAVRVASTVGARLGDFPQVSVAYAADISISAWVSANNTTSYVMENKTASEITLPVGTIINIKVFKI